MRAFTGWIAAALMLCASTASAQVRQPRFYVSAGAAGQVTSSEFRQILTFPLYEEDADIVGDVEPGTGVHVEFGVGLRVARRLGAGVQVSRASSTGRMDARYSLPSPFLFSAPRIATIETDSSRSILDVHLQARLDLIRTGPWRATIFGGPSFTWLDQALAPDRIAYTYAYPFDEVQLQDSGTGKSSGEGIGAHIGLTIARLIRPSIGLEGSMRWNGTTVDLESTYGPVRVETGGLQIGGGIQFRF